MTSNYNQQYVTVEIFNSATSKIEERFDIIDSRFISLDKTLTSIGYELRYNARDTEHLQTSVYWGFAILGIIITIVGIFAPLLLTMYIDTRKTKNDNDIREVAREVMHEEISLSVAQAVSETVTKIIGSVGK